MAVTAAEHGVSRQRIALAWLPTRSPMMVLVPGASRPASVQDSALAVRVRLGTAELTQLQAALPRV
ncbi:aldo/keto reductase [Streptomyces sp. DSM 15324]|uniref:aldo/keto reductase n=1 Tax=Streptomyces sp. DSM 15324 TaxID=1739111 RepID=UPI0022793B69|nr:aldo/keto reductase [Streptomyces sp. DSM 15324]